MNRAVKRMGRPPKPDEERLVDVGLRLHPGMVAEIDRRVDVEAGEDRSSVIRRLIRIGLDRTRA